MNASDVLRSTKYQCNQQVKTPLGAGTVLAPFAVVAEDGTMISQGVAVRLPVNDETEKALKQPNCLTPTAKLTGLWVFQEGEIS